MKKPSQGIATNPLELTAREALGFCGTEARDGILAAAVKRAGLAALPEDPITFRDFAKRYLLPVVDEQLGAAAAEEVSRFLEPILRIATPSPPTSGPVPSNIRRSAFTPPPLTPQPRSGDRPKSERRAILIADIDPAQRAALSMFLTGEGHAVVEADTAKVAVDMALSHPVGLVFCDFGVPGMAGQYLAMRLRRALGDLAPPVYEMTADAETSTRAGMAQALAKPVTPDAVLRVVEQVLKR